MNTQHKCNCQCDVCSGKIVQEAPKDTPKSLIDVLKDELKEYVKSETASALNNEYTAGTGLTLDDHEFSLGENYINLPDEINTLKASVDELKNSSQVPSVANAEADGLMSKEMFTKLEGLVDTNTTYTAGDGLVLDGTTFKLSADALSKLNNTSTNTNTQSAQQIFKRISQADYDALVKAGTVDENTLYVIQ